MHVLDLHPCEGTFEARRQRAHQLYAYVSIRQHQLYAYVSIRQQARRQRAHQLYAFVSIRQHKLYAYVSIRQHTSAFVSIRQHTPAYQHTPCVRNTLSSKTRRASTERVTCIRQHPSASVSIRQLIIKESGASTERTTDADGC